MSRNRQQPTSSGRQPRQDSEARSRRPDSAAASRPPARRNLPPQVTAVCRAARVDGQPCRAPATVRGEFCGQHAPETTPEMRREWARRGGLTASHRALAKRLLDAKLTEDQLRQILDIPDLGTAEKVSKYVERLVAEVKAGLLPPSLANAIRGLLDVKLRIEELALDAQLAAQLDEAEARAKGRGPRVVVAEGDQ